MRASLYRSAVVCSVLLLAGLGRAQASLSVPAVLTVGSTVDVVYSNPALAGKVVAVEIRCLLFPGQTTQTLEIQLDEHGRGSAPWTVPLAMWAQLLAPDAEVVERDIAP